MIIPTRHSVFVGIALLAAAAVQAEEPDARALVERMSSAIKALTAFQVEGDAYADARLDAGQIIEHSSQVTLRLRREPGSIRVTERNAEGSRHIFFDDGAVSVFSEHENLYARAEIPKGVDSMLGFVVDDLGIESPMLDLVAADVADHLLTDAEAISYLDKSLIRGRIYHHVGIRYPETDVQVWIAAEGLPLPGKLSISSKWEGGAPRFVGFFEWQTDAAFEDDIFRFEPPQDAIQIDFADRLPH